MKTNMMELNMNEMAAIAAGGMTREERHEVLAPKEGDGIVTTVGKAILRKVVYGIENFTDLVAPVTEQYTGKDARTAAMNIFKGAWKTIKSWF